ncbi:hypothetical protein [Streptomyces sp. NPDC002599]|uniref:hypothetical protein n=1 Tax=Streptomyces sp. NPDC002599 TaxID=3154421 RepID=UPI00331B874A
MRWWPGGGIRPWDREVVWPRRLHQVAGGNAGRELAWWRIVGRDAAIFPEVVAVAGALLDPAMGDLLWKSSGRTRPRARREDDAFCQRLGERVGRAWLGPLLAVDHSSVLHDWTGEVVRARRWSSSPGRRDDPWHLRRKQQPAPPGRAAARPGGRAVFGRLG